MINIDKFHETEIRIGKILSAEKVPETDKLLRLAVDFAEENPRQIVSGISAYFPDPQTLVGRHVAFVANLEPRTIKGLESQGMILAAHEGEAFSLLEVSSDIPPGTRVG
ncbi:MAG TPA: hypothetical protein VHF05_00105 [Candidatus Paceibacterota bacterium]|jgi:methionine--tRNA ligase beta chain|nr:hypothetical protein [Candidatus Paceibacterota bacterium]